MQSSVLAGGHGDSIERITLADGRDVVLKLSHADNASRLDGEAHGLRALSTTQTVRVPDIFGHGRVEAHHYIVMEYLESVPATSAHWRAFGDALARLHALECGSQYGFEIDNHCGPTPQINTWHDDWIEFNRACRIGYQVRLAADRGMLRTTEHDVLVRVVDRLDHLLPRTPKPALLHGDLWSGNARPLGDGAVAVIDPACSIGDGWADIAMMRLFGGFPHEAESAFAAHHEIPDDLAERIAVYQLYHVLNHVNLFGRGYIEQAMSLARRLV